MAGAASCTLSDGRVLFYNGIRNSSGTIDTHIMLYSLNNRKLTITNTGLESSVSYVC